MQAEIVVAKTPLETDRLAILNKLVASSRPPAGPSGYGIHSDFTARLGELADQWRPLSHAGLRLAVRGIAVRAARIAQPGA